MMSSVIAIEGLSKISSVRFVTLVCIIWTILRVMSYESTNQLG